MLPALQVEEEMDPWEILMQITSRRTMIMTSRKSPIPIAAIARPTRGSSLQLNNKPRTYGSAPVRSPPTRTVFSAMTSPGRKGRKRPVGATVIQLWELPIVCIALV